MKLLVVNDDGISAPGIAALEAAVERFGRPVVVAPELHLSGCGHQTTTSRPLAVRRAAEHRHAVDGTPADCTRIGLLHLAPDVTWVVSGINDGSNLGVDIYMSGTVAAVREAALLGRPAVAFSQYRLRDQAIDWPLAGRMVSSVMERLLREPLPPGAYWNVNLPAVEPGSTLPEMAFCPPDLNALPVSFERQDEVFHYRADYHARHRGQGTDVDVCFSGRIAISRISLRTDW
ncbi:MAG: 5'/3'-nucleotidase SurE [Pirellulaceae bacterium]|nr:5'/3'-nucleotidase SurE [Pirellulaceae bacterium]